MRKKKNREKFSSFSDFILNDKDFVFKFLIVVSRWFGAIIFTLLFFMILYYTDMIGLQIFIGAMALFGWYGVIKFYKLGGLKTMPKASTAEMFWNKENGVRIRKK